MLNQEKVRMDKKKILIIDDEVDLVEILSLRLRASGYEVDSLPEGEGALEKIRSCGADLVILDIMLPKVDGYKICEEIKKDPKLSSIPVILLTAKDPKEEKEKFELANPNDCIMKPFEPRDLLDKIKVLIRESSES